MLRRPLITSPKQTAVLSGVIPINVEILTNAGILTSVEILTNAGIPINGETLINDDQKRTAHRRAAITPLIHGT